MATGLSGGAAEAVAGRADIKERTLRKDAWWRAPLTTFLVLSAFVVYSTWAAFVNADYTWEPYISPFYSPCIASICKGSSSTWEFVGTWWPISPAILILIFPLGFRLTCYYYRKAYYRSFWLSPPACSVAEPHKSYSGENRFPLVLQNIHRYFLYPAVGLNVILTFDAIVAFRDHTGAWGHMGLGTLVLLANAVLLWTYTLGCHSCRHLCGGNVNRFSRHPYRFWLWKKLTWFNERHMPFAWASLVMVALADLYVRLVASGTIHDPRFF
jgi:hypothetical protein